MNRLSMLLEVFCLLIFFAHQQVIAEVVTCNHNTPVCECTTASDEACEFTLDIEMLQTFTRYLLDNTGDSRGTAGSVWHINNGEWEPVDPKDTLCGNSTNSEESKRCTQPFGVDGYTFRSFIAVNGRMPGPTLIVTEGQLVKVKVVNRLASESVSVHWHGMHQRNSNWMDGVEHVTQCGIPPGTNFTYIFNASQYGTHWYHSHSGAQRTDGLFGALIVKEKDNTERISLLSQLTAFNITGYRDNPAEHTLTLLDWQKSSSLDLFTQIHSGITYFDIDKASELQGNRATGSTSSDSAEIGPVPYWSGLINGRGRHNDTEYSNSILSDFKVAAGQTYRFRLIGAQSLYAYRFSIEGHNLTVIATDGQFIEPIEVDYIIIHSGERYDFLLKTNKEDYQEATTRLFMIRAVTLSFTATSIYATEQSAEAILNYNSDTTPSSEYANIAARSQTVRERCTSTDKCIALNCPFKNFPDDFNINCTHIHQLKLLTDYPTNELPTIITDQNSNSRKFFNFGFEGTRQTSTINGRNLKLPSASLAQLDASELADIRNKEFCKQLNVNSKCDRNNEIEVISQDCYCTHVVDVEADRSIELVISATGPNATRLNNFLFAHPIHLHGHYFHVVDIQFGEYDNNQKLTAGNRDINCGGNQLCTNPSWKTNMDYSTRTGMTGRVSSKAPLKDTLLIPAGGYAVVYFKTDNPGWWFLHCHIEVHQLEGMGVIINEGGFKTPPPGGMYKCGEYFLELDEFKTAIAVTASPTPEPSVKTVTETRTRISQVTQTTTEAGPITTSIITRTTIQTGILTTTTVTATNAPTVTTTTTITVTATPTSDGDDDGVKCFPPDAVVRTRNGPLLMKDVEIGMELLAVSSNHELVYSPVILMLDVDDIKLANYTIIESSGNQKLTLTPNHLVHASKTKDISSSVPIFASQVKKGDMIFVVKSPDVIEAAEVVSTSIKVIKGAYAPLTKEGTVVVDDVIASCYAVVNDHQFAHAMFGPLRYLYDTFHTSLHSKQKQGIAWYPSMLQSLGKVFLDDSNYKPMKVEDLIKNQEQ